MFSRLVRIQLVIFTIISIVGMVVMAFAYLQVPMLLGVNKITVTLELPAGGGLYRFSNVTYRGVQVGKVTSVALTRAGAKATLKLDTSPRIPADLRAEVRSMSAVGEQYVELRPHTDSPPYLRDGSVIPLRDTMIPQRVGPMLDRVSALVDSVPKDNLGKLLDESFNGFNGAGYDLSSLFDSVATVAGDVNEVANRTRSLVDDSVPLLDSQADTTDVLRRWARSLAGVTNQLVADDPPVRTLLQNGPGFAQDTARLLEQIKPTLPVLLANLTTVGQIAVTYNPGLEQLLVLLPPWAASYQTAQGINNPTGIAAGDFHFNNADPNACTIGYLPPSQWRSPADTSVIDTPDGLYCKLPQDSPIDVRGVRNFPCMNHPGKRAPTVEICDSDKPYVPLAMRPHMFGPSPLDPNLAAQGIPPDDRINSGNHIFGPVQGTPGPGGLLPSAPAPPGAPPPVLPGPVPPDQPAASPAPAPGIPSAAPSSASITEPGATPAPAVAEYDPRTGRYLAPDGHKYQQADLATEPGTKTWRDLIMDKELTAS
jgi:phospholipid/cholesterol/gamma-HCH transport system substrate-binding protein